MTNRHKAAIDKIAQKLKSLLEDSGHQVEINRSDAEPGYCLVIKLEKVVDGLVWTRFFIVTNTSPMPCRYPRWRMFFVYFPGMNANKIFEEVTIDHHQKWPTDWIWDPRNFSPRKDTTGGGGPDA